MLWTREKSLAPAKNQNQAIQPIDCDYTDNSSSTHYDNVGNWKLIFQSGDKNHRNSENNHVLYLKRFED
jgi:hypothetical protein